MKLIKQVALYTEHLRRYPESNPAYVSYYLDQTLLCTFPADLYLMHDGAELMDYGNELMLTDEECDALFSWYLRGNSIYDNPMLLCDEDGAIMDFVTALRAEEKCRFGRIAASLQDEECADGDDEDEGARLPF